MYYNKSQCLLNRTLCSIIALLEQSVECIIECKGFTCQNCNCIVSSTSKWTQSILCPSRKIKLQEILGSRVLFSLCSVHTYGLKVVAQVNELALSMHLPDTCGCATKIQVIQICLQDAASDVSYLNVENVIIWSLGDRRYF